MNIILYQVQCPIYYHKHCKHIREEALDTEIATVFEGSESGIEEAYKSVRAGYTAYMLSVREIPPKVQVLLRCHLAVAEGHAKLIATSTSVKAKKIAFDWGRQSIPMLKGKTNVK
jgi:hypothetical protein